MQEFEANLYHIGAQTARLMVGLPDYATYAEHRRKHYPGEPMMSREEFFRDGQERRYAPGGGRGLRCCYRFNAERIVVWEGRRIPRRRHDGILARQRPWRP